MRSARTLALLALVMAGCARADGRLESSRAIAAEFQQTLGGELKSALAEHGPVHAIEVCADVAPAIAREASAASGAGVGRTALRVRNPDNAPDAGARAVLEDFRERVAGGAAMPVEHFEAHDDGSARYMRAIVMQPLCVTCHGEPLAGDVAEALAAHYPDDAATGFEVGELRGAFVIDWPAGQDSP